MAPAAYISYLSFSVQNSFIIILLFKTPSSTRHLEASAIRKNYLIKKHFGQNQSDIVLLRHSRFIEKRQMFDSSSPLLCFLTFTREDKPKWIAQLTKKLLKCHVKFSEKLILSQPSFRLKSLRSTTYLLSYSMVSWWFQQYTIYCIYSIIIAYSCWKQLWSGGN
jgi:hypothetical protein